MLPQRKATLNDLATIIALLANDELGVQRESSPPLMNVMSGHLLKLTRIHPVFKDP